MPAAPLGVAVVGCGNIAGKYVETLVAQPSLRLVGASDLDVARAAALAERFDGRVFASLDDLLADDAVDLVVNLTTHRAHAEVNRRCLEAGRHVHSEKPLALDPRQAHALADLADRRGLRLSCAPITHLGEAQQTAWQALRAGRVGRVRAVYADINHGRIETWHPAPAGFYEVGVLWDVGVYPITLLTAFFGPVRRVQAIGRTLLPERRDLAGRPFRVGAPDFVVAMLDLEGGVVARLTGTFYVSVHGKQGSGMEFHGDAGSLYLGSWQYFDAPVELAPYDASFEPLPYVGEPFPGTDWSRGVVDVAAALRDGRPHRATGRHAAHVVDVIAALHASADADGVPVAVSSSFPAPPPPA